VAEQSWTDIEHVVIDGASTDDTLQAIEPFRGGLAHLVSERDNGIYDAMNKGLSLVTGDVICFLNSDDLYADKGVLTRVAKQFEGGDRSAVFGDVAYFRQEAEELDVRRFNSGTFHPSRLDRGFMPAHPALFLKRSVFEKIGPFRTDYRIAGDFEWIVRAFGTPIRYQYLPEVLVRMQAGGISTAGWRSRVTLNREILRACRDNGIRTNLFKVLSRYPHRLFELRWRSKAGG
jgi:glycosyltransferase involved in cell wall biosynthesis